MDIAHRLGHVAFEWRPLRGVARVGCLNPPPPFLFNLLPFLFFCFVFVFSSCRFLFIHVLKNRRAHEQRERNLNAAFRCEAPVKQACPIRDFKKQAFYVITILVVLLTIRGVGVSRHPRKTSPPQGNVSKAGGAPTTPTAQEKDATGTIRYCRR